MGKFTEVKPKRTYKEKKGIVEQQEGRLANYELSSAQKQFQNVIRSNIITFAEGYAGVGKSLSTLHYFVRVYNQDPTKNIVVIKTPVESAGQDKIGYLPSDYNAKIEPHFESTKKLLGDLMGKGKMEADIGKRIHFSIPNFQLGNTLDNSLILIDEAQMLEPFILKLLLERIGQNSVCVVTGDSTQIYSNTKGRNALKDALPRFFHTSEYANKVVIGDAKASDIGYFQFTVDDVKRADIVKTVIKAYTNQL